MKGDEARLLLGFPPNSRPTPSQVKAAYKRKVWECHPDLFPAHQHKPLAESNFKLISEAYTCLLSSFPLTAMLITEGPHKFSNELLNLKNLGISPSHGGRGEDLSSATYARVVKTGVPRAQRGSYRNHALVQVPFLFLVLGTVALGGFNVTRAYRKQKEAYSSHNPFLP